MFQQMRFYTTEDDEVMITDILNSIFEQMVEVPFHKKEVFNLDEKAIEIEVCLLSEANRMKDMVYGKSELFDGTISEPLDLVDSPVLEYVPSYINSKGELAEGNFYCCSKDLDFSKKVSKFFRKLKKELKYVKKYRTYISNSVDLSAVKFDRERIITVEDL